MNTNDQLEIFKAMGNSGFYPHETGQIEVRETHISKVFLTGDFVYKVKKSLNLGFLDFSTLEKRRFFCDQEVNLNRRLSQDIYLGVVPIILDHHGGYHLGQTDNKGEIKEYAVKMRQLADSCSLQWMIQNQDDGEQAIARSNLTRLGEKLAQFYLGNPLGQNHQTNQDTQIDKGDKACNVWTNILKACRENFDQTREFTREMLDKKIWSTIKDETLSFLNDRKSVFQERLESGKVKDCHGDLRCDHIYFTPQGIQIIDCIEFNDSLRCIDVVNDLAFLLMDLDFQGQQGLGDLILNQYLELTGDLSAFKLLDFYKCYRAFVRCKVNSIFLKSTTCDPLEREKKREDALRYLDLAQEYAIRFSRPAIFVIHGLPGTGKSTMAKALGRALGLEPIRSDLVRKKIFNVSPHTVGGKKFKEKIYSSAASDKTYGRLIELARQEIEAGSSVILDATFGKKHLRGNLISLAEERGITPIFIECRTTDEIMRQRLLDREHSLTVSDARIDLFEPFRREYEPITDEENVREIVINTAAPQDECIRQLLVLAFSR
ncbi:MAG: AAA family ATPase [Desulfobacterium sp.]|nr:AAA family ATPase [Desulfobacterium sp.]